jgi:hypothetical protein
MHLPFKNQSESNHLWCLWLWLDYIALCMMRECEIDQERTRKESDERKSRQGKEEWKKKESAMTWSFQLTEIIKNRWVVWGINKADRKWVWMRERAQKKDQKRDGKSKGQDRRWKSPLSCSLRYSASLCGLRRGGLWTTLCVGWRGIRAS